MDIKPVQTSPSKYTTGKFDLALAVESSDLSQAGKKITDVKEW